MRFNKKYFFASFFFTLMSLEHAQAQAQTKKKSAATSSAASASSVSSAASSSAASASAAAATPKAAPAPTKTAEVTPAPSPEVNKAVDFTAKDVWSKDLFERDDNKVLVIQDRKYNKAGRLELGVDLGMTSATAFYNTYSGGVRAAYYFNEYWGLQWFGNYSTSTASREKEQLDNYFDESGFSSQKEYKQPRLFTGIGVLWNPIYGKFAWFRSRIIHFDVYAGLGLSYLTTESSMDYVSPPPTNKRYTGIDDAAIGSLANLGLRVYLSKNFAWTTEIRNNIYKAQYALTTTGGTSGTEIAAKDVWQNNFQFVTGVSYMFNIAGY